MRTCACFKGKNAVGAGGKPATQKCRGCNAWCCVECFEQKHSRCGARR